MVESRDSQIFVIGLLFHFISFFLSFLVSLICCASELMLDAFLLDLGRRPDHLVFLFCSVRIIFMRKKKIRCKDVRKRRVG